MARCIKDNTLLSEVFRINSQADRNILLLKERNGSIAVLDPGLHNVAVNQSAICSINRVNGQLSYRGVSIEDLASEDFLRVAYMLLFDKGSDSDIAIFKRKVYSHFRMYPEVKLFLDALPVKILPMDFLAAGIIALSAVENTYIESSENRIEKCAFILAQTSVIGIYHHNRYNEKSWIDTSHSPSEKFSYHVIRGINPDTSHSRLKKLGDILNTILVIHSEHGQNCSTATVRNVASAQSSIYSALSSGIASFKGRLHGGASQYVSEMYDEILSNDLDFNQYLNAKIQLNQPLMGFGQRTYNKIRGCWDPRVEIMMKIITAEDFVFPEIKPYTTLALNMIQRVVSDDYFVSRNLTPNPDLFNCIFYKLFGVHSTMNPLMITLGRVVGWMANFYEHIDDKYPLTRPCDIER